MQVRSFILINGQELIAELRQATGRGYQIRNPLVVQVMRGPDGNPSLAFMPWSHIRVEGSQMELFDAAVASCDEVTAEVEQAYIEQTTGISVPAKSQIITG